MNKEQSFFSEVFKFTVIALLIVIPIRLFIAQPFIVSGASMDPTFEDGEYLIVDQLSYHLNEPKRGEVVIFRYPNDPKKFFIKRIIGLPGETIEIRGTTVAVRNTENPNGFVLDEPYINTKNLPSGSLSLTLGATEYFVLGDNRAVSSDSRIWGALDEKFIIGTPIISLYPISKMDVKPGVHSY